MLEVVPPRLVLAFASVVSLTIACESGEPAPGVRAEPGPRAANAPAQTAAPRAARPAPAPLGAPAPAPPAADDHGWNSAQIAWQPFEAGLERARAEQKPLCLVLYTSWCPHCRNYAKVFDDPRVVSESKRFVMVRADTDREPGLGSRFAPDGEYIPRTFFLDPEGKLDPEVNAGRDRFRFFYDEKDPSALLGAMQRALGRLARPR
ncbi:MAG: thioredoxin family protein [Polyangiaceae bacterium]|nr:thioredoxin family protein [Polyangiaceae bacterium]